MVMSGHCLHFTGFVPKIKDAMTSKSASNITSQANKASMYGQLTSNQMVSQYRISCTWRHKQSIYFFKPQWVGAHIIQMNVFKKNK